MIGPFTYMLRLPLTAHYWVWEYGRVLHSDISDNNLMFKPNSLGAIREGMLIDFDYCLEVGTNAKIARSERSVSGHVYIQVGLC